MTIAKHPKTKQLSSVNGCRFTQKLFTKNIQTYPVLVGKTLYKMKGPGVKTCENSPTKLICMFKFTSTMMTKSCALLGLLSRYVGNTTAKKSHWLHVFRRVAFLGPSANLHHKHARNSLPTSNVAAGQGFSTRGLCWKVQCWQVYSADAGQMRLKRCSKAGPWVWMCGRFIWFC